MESQSTWNVVARFVDQAAKRPEMTAMIRQYDDGRTSRYRSCTFAELDADSAQIARGLRRAGFLPGMRIVLLVPAGITLVTLVLATLRAGITLVLIDPGMNRKHLLRCLEEVKPDGFIAIPLAQWVRRWFRRLFPNATHLVTVPSTEPLSGRIRWTTRAAVAWTTLCCGGYSLEQIRSLGAKPAKPAKPAKQNGDSEQTEESAGQPSGETAESVEQAGKSEQTKESKQTPTYADVEPVVADAPAAIIFTSGSTGPPKGVAYTHRVFDAQIRQIRQFYGIEPGGVDLACFPMFGFFDCVMGTTSVIPAMDPTRPAAADPKVLLRAINDQRITQTFGSPAIWNLLGKYAESQTERHPNEPFRFPEYWVRLFSSGAPMPWQILERMKRYLATDAEIYTPYGATESLPVASIGATEVLAQTAERTRAGRGVCVGSPFAEVEWFVIRIADTPIPHFDDATKLPPMDPTTPLRTAEDARRWNTGIGELIVAGPQVTQAYVTRTEWNAKSKIVRQNPDGTTTLFHRIGDTGYFDLQGRFWFCGRVAQRVASNSTSESSNPNGTSGLGHAEPNVLESNSYSEAITFGSVDTSESVENRTFFTIPCEAIFNQHPQVFRSALVGVPSEMLERPQSSESVSISGRSTMGSDKTSSVRPVIVVEPQSGAFPRTDAAVRQFREELRQIALANPLTATITTILFREKFPVDTRHNVKIGREELTEWAKQRIKSE